VPTLLPDVRVFIGGGIGDRPSFTLASPEPFNPTDPPFTVAGFQSAGSMSKAAGEWKDPRR
jgi:hypothetical protein